MRTEQDDLLAKLDAAIQLGLADIKAGRTRPLEEVSERLMAKYRAMAKTKSST